MVGAISPPKTRGCWRKKLFSSPAIHKRSAAAHYWALVCFGTRLCEQRTSVHICEQFHLWEQRMFVQAVDTHTGAQSFICASSGACACHLCAVYGTSLIEPSPPSQATKPERLGTTVLSLHQPVVFPPPPFSNISISMLLFKAKCCCVVGLR